MAVKQIVYDAIRSGTARSPGLLRAADWKLWTDARTLLNKYIKEFSGGGVRLETTGSYAMVAGKLGAHIAANAYYDGTNWNRYDTAQAASFIAVGQGQFLFYSAPAGANPIVWSVSAAQVPGASMAWLPLTLNPPRCRLYRTAAQSIPNVTGTAVSWTAAHENVAGAAPAAIWSAGTPTRLTAPIAGRYLFTATVAWGASAAGAMRHINLGAPGFQFAATGIPPIAGGYSPQMNVAGVVGMTAGSYVELNGYQDSGGALNLISDGGGQYPQIQAQRISP